MKKKFIKTELIEKYLQDNKLSKTGFCKKCKISPSTLKKNYGTKRKRRYCWYIQNCICNEFEGM